MEWDGERHLERHGETDADKDDSGPAQAVICCLALYSRTEGRQPYCTQIIILQ